LSGYQEENEELHGGNYRIAAIGGYSNWCYHAAVITAQKRLKRLKEGISNSSFSVGKRQELEKRVNDFMERLESLPQDKSQPCQKTAGNCVIGAGCFASGALKLMDLITEPAPPKNL
jgi:hypothetical protein